MSICRSRRGPRLRSRGRRRGSAPGPAAGFRRPGSVALRPGPSSPCRAAAEFGEQPAPARSAQPGRDFAAVRLRCFAARSWPCRRARIVTRRCRAACAGHERRGHRGGRRVLSSRDEPLGVHPGLPVRDALPTSAAALSGKPAGGDGSLQVGLPQPGGVVGELDEPGLGQSEELRVPAARLSAGFRSTKSQYGHRSPSPSRSTRTCSASPLQPGCTSVGLDERGHIVEYVANEDRELLPVRLLGGKPRGTEC